MMRLGSVATPEARKVTAEGRAALGRFAFIGSYVPRQCGIATFTADLAESLSALYPESSFFALPINDREEGYLYPPRVRFEVAENDVASYRRAADFLNINNIDLVCLQHEFGIFGGPAGSHVLALLRELRMPVVTTLHTVLEEPDAEQRHVMEELTNLSERVVVMSRHAVRFLKEIYRVPEGKVDLIPHGIPDVPFVDSNFYKDQFGVEGRQVLLTFGLLSPNKGIENVIAALPAILERHPSVVYMVLGATHPHLVRHDGEAYRFSLERMARDLDVEEHIIFHNRFVSLEELMEFVGVADVYISPYLDRGQVVSGTLAYAVGAGKAVVATPYLHAQELLDEQRGILVPFADPAALAEKSIELLDNEVERHAMRKRAYMYGREMIWPVVAERYMATFGRAREERSHQPRAAFLTRALEQRPRELPGVKLDHLRRMTDTTGIIQHAIFIVPNFSEGYTTDDNARALITAIQLEVMGNEESRQAHGLASVYLAFLWHAFNPDTRRFRNLLSYDRRWLEESGSEDSHGRAIWGLGTVLGRSRRQGLRGPANRLFELSLPSVLEFTSPRAWAFTLHGIVDYMTGFSGDRVARNVMETLAERLLKLHQEHSAPEWPWFEPIVSYCNAALPQALFTCGRLMQRADMERAGLDALEWLISTQKSEEGHFVPIGSNGFYERGGERNRFDQQPVEAHATVSACLEAHTLTGDRKWMKEAQRAFDWYLGRNDLRASVYDPATGGCRDGIHPDRVNQNQGAESTLSFLQALLELRLHDRE